MNLQKHVRPLLFAALILGFGVNAEAADGNNQAYQKAGRGHVNGGAGSFGISGDLGYFTYGMSDVNARFNDGRNADFSGGLGSGASVKLGLTDHFAAKVGIDYLFARRASHRTIGGIDYATQVDLPATVLFLGGEYVFLPVAFVHLTLIGGYTYVSIYNGQERTDSGALDLGAITGSGSGFQAGLGAEVFLAPAFSLEADLGYNYANLAGSTFAGGPADPGTRNQNGSVDYSGMMVKAAFTIYLVP